MLRTARRLIPSVAVVLMMGTFVTSAHAAREPARVEVLKASAALRDDGSAALVVRARCASTLQAFELDVTVRQGSVTGSVSIVQAGVVVCDGAWHRVAVEVPPSTGAFTEGVATVDVFLGVFDPDAGDLDATATARVRL
jgi:hypothetical protein